jgi:hypothetical protein
MPEKNKISLGVESHFILKRYLENSYGKVRSRQYFLDLSYGLSDWFSIDLKGGAGNIIYRPSSGEGLDYPTAFAGGYGFRLRLFEKNDFRGVFGFQHISVHPQDVDIGNDKHKAILDDWQTSLLISYDFKKFVPYVGTRWSRIDYIHTFNGSRKRIMSDLTKSYGLILGADIMLPKKFRLNVEGSFFDSEACNFSLNYDF